MRYSVFLSDDANRDLHELYNYIARHDSPNNADKVLSRIENIFNDLTEY
ncbi:MAG: type II toxin-antitoxin system RelE/ParE family toxin, partial [Deltaproteobacteria bacterium]|nr:type II toxin-antitoxin system RelE/ParE family toxin [Deltaproteobacteria bacterium]